NARISAARIRLRGARPSSESTKPCARSLRRCCNNPTPHGWTRSCANITCGITQVFSRTRQSPEQSRGKSQAKRNPEMWGDTSGLNVAYKDQYNKAQTPEHNVCSCCYEI